MTTTLEITAQEQIVEQINKAKKEFVTDGYTMSIGEIISMYRDGELVLHTDLDKNFEWNLTKQTSYIESIFIGFPLPAILVSQDEQGHWEVIDGYQRLSTIFQFVGKLKNAKGIEQVATALEAATFLPALKDMSWEKLPIELQLRFRRTPLDFKIIRVFSKSIDKHEIFKRLNA